MIFFFKNKKIIVDCFTNSEHVSTYYPIVKSAQKLPDWWRALDTDILERNQFGTLVPSSTMKRCKGFTDHFKNSFSFSLWSDLSINLNKDGNWGYAFSNPISSVEIGGNLVINHTSQAYGPEFDDFFHIKITSPWQLHERTGIKFVWQPAFWNNIKRLNDFFIIPGITDFKYNGSTNINLLINKRPQDFFLYAGTPLIYFIPLTDKNVEFRCHYDPKEHLRIASLKSGNFFNNSYSKLKNNINNIEKEGKCPFHFGKK